MKSRFVFTSALGLLAAVLPAPVPLAAVPSSPPVQGGCPDRHAIGNFLTSTEVAVIIADDGTGTGTNNYFFTGVPLRSSDTPPGNVIPGLIQYCVYPAAPSPLPGSGGGDYDSWTYGPARDHFSFKRPDGDPTNVPYDSTPHQIGHASWGATAPASQAILLHVNDPDECDALYGGNPGTCFVYPGLITSGGGESR